MLKRVDRYDEREEFAEHENKKSDKKRRKCAEKGGKETSLPCHETGFDKVDTTKMR
jgi:hypothetical protein